MQKTYDKSNATKVGVRQPLIHSATAALAAALSNASALPRLEDFPLWRDAPAITSDVTTELTQVSAAEQPRSTASVAAQDEQDTLGFGLARRIVRRRR